MERKITIGNKEVRLKSSLFTMIAYKNQFGTDLFQDVSKMDVKEDKETQDVSSVIQVLFQIIYVLNNPFNDVSFDEFLNQFDFEVLTDTNSLTKAMQVIGELLGSAKNKQNNKTPYKGTKPYTNK